MPVWAATDVTYTPQVDIPGGPEGTVNENSVGQYVQAVYNYGIGIAGILAAVVIMAAGVMWLVAGGNAGRVEEAKEWIKAAVTGLILALVSYTILLTINPDLIKLNPITITPVSTSPISNGPSRIIENRSCWRVQEQTCPDGSFAAGDTECAAGQGTCCCKITSVGDGLGDVGDPCENNGDCKPRLLCVVTHYNGQHPIKECTEEIPQ